jgi:hypothetical protein
MVITGQQKKKIETSHALVRILQRWVAHRVAKPLKLGEKLVLPPFPGYTKREQTKLPCRLQIAGRILAPSRELRLGF